jgi:hypothetical protein
VGGGVRKQPRRLHRHVLGGAERLEAVDRRQHRGRGALLRQQRHKLLHCQHRAA